MLGFSGLGRLKVRVFEGQDVWGLGYLRERLFKGFDFKDSGF